jgi:hypothetical protein
VILGGRHGRVGAVAFVVVAAVGCGGDDGGSESAESSSTTGTSEPADVEVIEAYVAAMGEGDVDAAMELRCEAGRISADERDLFEDDLRRLTDGAGRLGVGRVEVTDEDPAVEASLQSGHPVELTYWMTLDGEEVDEPLVSVVVDEDGERRMCTFSTTELARMQATLGDGLADLGPVEAGELVDLMPPAAGPGYVLHADGRLDPTTLSGVLDAGIDMWRRSWRRAGYGGVTVSAIRFGSPAEAMEAARGWMARVDDPAVETFEVPGLAGAQGVRFLALEWLWLQPPTVGPYIDEVSLVLGDTYVTVGVGGVPTGTGHETAIAVAREVADPVTG